MVFNQTFLNLIQKFPNAKPEHHDTYINRLCLALGGNIVIESRGHMKYRQHKGNVIGLNITMSGNIKRAITLIRSTALRSDTMLIANGDIVNI